MPVSILPRTIRGRLLLITASCLVMTFIGMAAVIVFGLPQGLLPGGLRQQEQEALARLDAVADNKRGLLTLWFSERLGDLVLAGKNPLLAAFPSAKLPAAQQRGDGEAGMDPLNQDVLAWLRNIRGAYTDYHYIDLIAVREGVILLSSDKRRIGSRTLLPQKNKEEIPIPGELFAFFESEDEGASAFLCLAVHLVPSGARATPLALVFHVDTATLTNKLLDVPLLGVSGEILLVDMHRLLLTPLRHPLRSGASALPLQTTMETKMAQYAAWGSDGVMQALDYRGVSVLGAVRHIRVLPDFGLGMVVQQDQAEVFAPIYQRLLTLGAIACSGLAVLLMVIFFMARSLLKPVEEVTAAACHLRDGDLAARAAETGSGEALILAIAFNVMAGEVQRWNEGLTATVEERTAELSVYTRRLEESEARLHAILENSVDAIGVLKKGLHVYVNAAYLQLFGYDALEELSGRFILDLIAPGQHSEFLDLMARLHSEGSPLSDETHGRRSNGEIFDLDVRLSAFELVGEAHTLLIFRDITERKKAVQEWVALLDFNRVVVDHAPVGILVYDDSGQCVLANQAAAEVFGTTTDHLVRQNFHDLESWRQCGLFELALKAMGAAAMAEGFVHIIMNPGREAWLHARFFRLGSFNDRLILIMSDLTELKMTQDDLVRMNQELQVKAGQLEALNTELESFNHTVSHDLRTPIRALAGFPDLLESHLGDRLDDKGRQYLAAIRSAACRMSEITTDLLNFSRLGRVDIAMTDVDLSVLVRKVMEDLAVMAKDRQVVWQVADLPVVKGDVNLLRIALTNLLANALKFTRLKTEAVIRVESSVGGDGVPVFKVSDNGAGFDNKYADRLFKVFSRLHPSEEFEGTGIGLATVSRIVRRHGGKIWADGRPGEGASFSFTLASEQFEAAPPFVARRTFLRKGVGCGE